MVFVAGFGDIDEMDLAKERKFNKELDKTIRFYTAKTNKPEAELLQIPICGRHKFKGRLKDYGYLRACKRSEELNKRMKEINKRRTKNNV